MKLEPDPAVGRNLLEISEAIYSDPQTTVTVKYKVKNRPYESVLGDLFTGFHVPASQDQRCPPGPPYDFLSNNHKECRTEEDLVSAIMARIDYQGCHYFISSYYDWPESGQFTFAPEAGPEVFIGSLNRSGNPRKLVDYRCDSPPSDGLNYYWGLDKKRIYRCPDSFSKKSGAPWPEVCANSQLGAITTRLLQFDSCGVGNPCIPSTGAKIQEETDFQWGKLHFARSYSSIRQLPDIVGLDGAWGHSLGMQVLTPAATDNVLVREPKNTLERFRKVATDRFASVNIVGRTLVRNAASTVARWVLTDRSNERWEFDDKGVLRSIRYPDAPADDLALNYCDGAAFTAEQCDFLGALVSVSDGRGRLLAFAYRRGSYTGIAPSVIYTPPRLIGIADDEGQLVAYQYDEQGHLAQVTYRPSSPDSVTRTYFYGEADHLCLDSAGVSTSNCPASGFPQHLTGILDEKGVRFLDVTYDSFGRATSSRHPGDADKVVLSYSATGTQVVMASGEQRTYVYGSQLFPRLATYDVVGGGVVQRTYYADDRLKQLIDARGNVTEYAYDSYHETSRVDAKGTAEQRAVQTDWHSAFDRPVERRILNVAATLEAKTAWSYNTRGQATARCEIDPADATAMAYACSATAAPPAAAKVRRTVTTYCEPADVTAGTCPLVGLVTSVNGPRPAGDAGMAAGQDDRTTYTYYPSDDASCASNGACPHRKGDLWKLTNALGQVTTYVTYDKNGRVTRTQDANGTVTDFVYHVRGWLTDRILRASATGTPGAGDATTHIDYDAVGNVRKVIQPDGAFLAYTYDDAHRLIRIADNLSNTIDYCPGGVGSAQCLDAAGNRRVEQVKDPSGAIKRALSRSYNQLSQLVRLNNAAGSAVEQSQGLSETGVADGYDGNGNRVRVQDGLGIATRQRYDGLNRLVETLQNDNGSDPATTNTGTGYVYDTRDNLRQVTDPDGLNTVYDYDGLNNLTGLHSPDTGDSSYTYDLAGNRRTQTDARGVTSSYAYDVLNRLAGIGYPTASLNVGYAYDQSNAVTGCATSYPLGRLTTMSDASGSTTYCYDRRGNVTRKKQVTGGTTLTTDYAYTVADRLASITYPSGAIVAYARDTLGRVTAVTWKANAGAAATTIVSNASYYPFGPLNVLTYGNGRTLSKTYDQDYAIDYVLSSVTGGLALNLDVDVMGNIVSAVKPGDLSRGPTPIPTLYAYDPLYRLKDVQQPLTTGTLESYTYNKTGDRLSAQLDAGPVTSYTYAAGSHRLASVGGVARTYDANGNTQTGTAPGQSLTYDDRNRLTGMSQSGASAEYKINGRGERVVKTVTTGGGPFSVLTTTFYVYDEGGRLLGDYGAAGSAQTEYVYLDGAPIAAVKGGSLSYIETDHLGTPRVVADPATNAARWAWNFFGDTFGANAPDPSPGGAAAYTLNLRFPGQYYDAETKLNYNYFRDYEPVTGRYVEPDPIGLRGGLNSFLYAGANSLKFMDPFGLKNFCYYAPDFFYEWFPGKGYVKIQYNRTECVNIPDPPLPPSPDCLKACYESWNFCVFMADIKLFDVGVGLATGGPLAPVRASVGVVGGAAASAGASALGIGSDTVRKGCDVGYGRCVKNCECRNSQ